VSRENPTKVPDLLVPPDDAKIWRYMDLAKFLFFLNRKSITFAKPSTFEDPYEGAATKFGRIVRRIWFDTYIKNGGDEKEGKENLEMALKRIVESTYISCWHISDHESDAMWKLYGQVDGAVAIQTTFGKLRKQLPASGFIAGKVQYIDYETAPISWNEMISPFFFKRKSFEHEREVRFFMRIPSNTSRRVASFAFLDINDVFENLYISPLAGKWVADTVRETCKKFECNIEVVHSELYESPPTL
jgi:hypothetical protein